MKKTQIKLFLIVLIFVVPIIASWFLYYYHNHFQLNTINHGVLINPPIDVRYAYPAGKDETWRVVYVVDAVCDTSCKKMEYQLYQVKKALGKKQERVSIVIVNNRSALKDFSVKNRIYLVDPSGNLFMYYSDKVDPMDILKDLKRLLEVSQIG